MSTRVLDFRHSSLTVLNIFIVNNVKLDQNAEVLQVLSADIAPSGFCYGTRSIERLVTHMRIWTLQLLIVRRESSISHVSAEEISIAVDAYKILRFAFVLCQ